MKKINLVLQPNQFTSFTSYYLETYWRRYFDISIYDPAKTYNRSGTIFVFWWMNADDALPARLKEIGYQVAIDNLWEYPTGKKNFYWIEYIDWFRLNESLWWRALGYYQYQPKKKYSYRAFMPCNRVTPFRDLFHKKIEPLLHEFIWSYPNRRSLPGDVGKEFLERQRFMNPCWYDDTYCSAVFESSVDHIWITEKSLKPIGFYHPFVVLAAPGQLKKIKSLGFETFDNIFDESYDAVDDLEDRIAIIRSNLEHVDCSQPYDQETLSRLQHNHDLFFDVDLVEAAMTRHIVEPLLCYAEI
jgi:hypothetical protein